MIEIVLPYSRFLLSGALITVSVALSSLAVSLAIGLLGAWGSLSGSSFVRRVVSFYTLVVRAIPDLVLMLLIYYGGQAFINQIGDRTGLWDYREISTFGASVATIAFIFGAYMTETFRGAALCIPRGEIEAGIALGLPRLKQFTRIVFPQLLRYALPGIGNNWQVLMKTTALVSIIGLEDIVFNSFQAGRSSHHMFLFLAATMVAYLFMTAISGAIFFVLAKKYGLKTRAANA
ncbi:ABC transporter permease [Rhizobium beringeri]|uniref:ABC transporter permease n=1 Tax=Rhizobium beringeri TaxID=3019934 RepID=UPI003B593A0D